MDRPVGGGLARGGGQPALRRRRHLDPGRPRPAARAVVELEVSWKGKPSFIVALGVGDGEVHLQHPFRFEVWGDDLVAVGETEEDADVVSLQGLGPGPGRLHVLAFLDRENGRFLVTSAGGRQLADIRVQGARASRPGASIWPTRRATSASNA